MINELDPARTGLLVVDVQDKLFPKVQRPEETLAAIQLMTGAARALSLPIVVSEQYPDGLGATIPPLVQLLADDQLYWDKTAFSALGDAELAQHILSCPVDTWVVIGIETHVCILQTVRDLIKSGKQAIVPNDAISSRSLYDYSTGIGEMRDLGARISSVEIVLFELLKDAKHPIFKQISALIKAQEQACPCG